VTVGNLGLNEWWAADVALFVINCLKFSLRSLYTNKSYVRKWKGAFFHSTAYIIILYAFINYFYSVIVLARL